MISDKTVLFFFFKIMILECGETKWLGLGVVFEDYSTDLFPGWDLGTVGYHTDDRLIFDSENGGKKTIGMYCLQIHLLRHALKTTQQQRTVLNFFPDNMYVIRFF